MGAEKADGRPVSVTNPVGVDFNTPTAAVGLHNPVGVEPPTNGRPDGDQTAVFLRRYADGNAVGVFDFFINKVLLISVFTFIYLCINWVYNSRPYFCIPPA